MWQCHRAEVSDGRSNFPLVRTSLIVTLNLVKSHFAVSPSQLHSQKWSKVTEMENPRKFSKNIFFFKNLNFWIFFEFLNFFQNFLFILTLTHPYRVSDLPTLTYIAENTHPLQIFQNGCDLNQVKWTWHDLFWPQVTPSSFVVQKTPPLWNFFLSNNMVGGYWLFLFERLPPFENLI